MLDHSFNGDGARYCLGRPVSLAEKGLSESKPGSRLCVVVDFGPLESKLIFRPFCRLFISFFVSFQFRKHSISFAARG